MITSILTKATWLYVGALVPIYMAKLTIVTLDERTNALMPTLICLLLASTTLFLKVLGY